MLEVPPEAVDLAKRFEGFHRIATRVPVVMASPYLCPAGYWTIAWGHLCDQGHEPVTMEEGERYLEQDMRTALSAVITACPRILREPRARLAVLVDFTFNLGGGRLRSSTLRRRVNEGRWGEVPAELRKWVWGGGRKLPGLVARREAEALLV